MQSCVCCESHCYTLICVLGVIEDARILTLVAIVTLPKAGVKDPQ